jgi:two-component system, OmpR family, response regulator
MSSIRLALLIHDAELAQHLAVQFRGQDLEPLGAEPTDPEQVPEEADVVVIVARTPDDPMLALLQRWRGRSSVGALVLSVPPLEAVFRSAMVAGADMVLPVTMQPDLLAMAVRRIHARSEAGMASDVWRLDAGRGVLLAPDGAQVGLSRTDLLVMSCLQDAVGGSVSREELAQRLGLDMSEPNALHATIYRLRRRIQRATTAPVPLHARSRQGYAFRAPLLKAGA